MTDIYLNCNSSNLKVAEALKKEVESRSKLAVAVLDNKDDEDEENLDFMNNIARAKQMIIILTKGHATITAWVIDRNYHRIEIFHRRQQNTMMTMTRKPQYIDFSKSQSSGMQKLLALLQPTTENKVMLSGTKRPPYSISKVWKKRTKGARTNQQGALLLL
ncbi:unnamed protein product [Cylindrotheca closterium]|uniref:Uncharacterized protein n=1 Tax=Cylindrotheca closterium TaxID=2856 RepID=A0AAD2JGK0_9STRA|nr:unnamed protein product [Cylindrotheca closterium]